MTSALLLIQYQTTPCWAIGCIAWYTYPRSSYIYRKVCCYVCNYKHFTRQTNQIDHILTDHLDSNLRLYVLQDLYSTDPTQEIRANYVLDDADHGAPTQQHELDHSDQ